MSISEINLVRDKPGPWGFRLQGGVDFEKALSVVFVNEGSFSFNSGLRTGDVILRIGDLEGGLLTHKEAQEAVIEQGNLVRVTIQRTNNAVSMTPPGAWKPSVQVIGGPATVPGGQDTAYTKTSLALQPPPQEEHFDVRHNVVARGFQAGAPAPGFKSVAAPVTKPGQDQPDAAGNGFRSVGPSGMNPGAPISNQPPICWVCSKAISGVFLQAKGQPLHADCFICFTCQTPLRNVGHFAIGGKLYCQTHAREAQNLLHGKTTSEPVDSNSTGQIKSAGPSGQMPQGLAANLARLSMKPQQQKPGGQQPGMVAGGQQPGMVDGGQQPGLVVGGQPGGQIGGQSGDWNNRLNANSAGMANNAEDFTKEFMKELNGGTGV